MPTYYVNKAEPQEQIKTKYGNWLVPYKLELGCEDGQTYEAEVLQKPETPPPSGNIKGTITAGPYGNKFTKEKPPEGQRTEYTSGKTPEERARIERMHDQQMAIMWVAVLQKNQQTAPQNPNYEYLKGVIDWFGEDVKAAGNA